MAEHGRRQESRAPYTGARKGISKNFVTRSGVCLDFRGWLRPTNRSAVLSSGAVFIESQRGGLRSGWDQGIMFKQFVACFPACGDDSQPKGGPKE